MFKALEAYRNASCYSSTNEDVITIGISIGVCSIFSKEYDYGAKYVKDAVQKNEENPTGKARTQLLSTIQALVFIGQGKYEKVCS